MGEKGAVISKQQLSDVFLDGFRVCEEKPKVEETAVCSETDVAVLFCLMEHDAEEDGEQCGGQNTSLLDAVGEGEAVQQTHCASPDLVDLHGAGRECEKYNYLKSTIFTFFFATRPPRMSKTCSMGAKSEQ